MTADPASCDSLSATDRACAASDMRARIAPSSLLAVASSGYSSEGLRDSSSARFAAEETLISWTLESYASAELFSPASSSSRDLSLILASSIPRTAASATLTAWAASLREDFASAQIPSSASAWPEASASMPVTDDTLSSREDASALAAASLSAVEDLAPSASALLLLSDSTASSEGTSSGTHAGLGWCVDPHTGHGSPSLRAEARRPACDLMKRDSADSSSLASLDASESAASNPDSSSATLLSASRHLTAMARASSSAFALSWAATSSARALSSEASASDEPSTIPRSLSASASREPMDSRIEETSLVTLLSSISEVSSSLSRAAALP